MTKKHISLYPHFADLNINEQQQRFVMIYCRPDMNFNATRSYCLAYGKDDIDDYNSAGAAATRLLKDVRIMEAIDRERARLLENNDDLVKTMINELAKVAMADMTETIRVTGPIVSVKDLSEIPQHLRSCIKSIKTSSNGMEIQFHDKLKAIEVLGKALGMFVEKVQNVNEEYESIVDRIERQRQEKKK
jgi:phage terminase small subunit